MKQKRVHAALVAAFVVQMTGCASSSPEQKASSQLTQQRVIEALKIAPRGPVELTVGYCDSQRDLPALKQVVAIGDTAVFDPTAATIYELKVKPLKTEDGKMVMLMTAHWLDKVERQDVLFSRQILTNDGEISPQSVLNINGIDSCFTVTALSGSTN
jgi:hypothetical protein